MSLFSVNSIKTRLTFILLLVASVATFLIFSAFVSYDLYRFNNQFDSEIDSTAKIIVSNSTTAVKYRSKKTASKVLSALEGNDTVVAAFISDKKGKVLASYNKKGEDHSIEEITRYKNSSIMRGDYRSFESGIFFNGEKIGTLGILTDLKIGRTSIIKYHSIALLFLCLTLIFVYLLSIRFQKLVSKPISSLASFASNVSSKNDYSARTERQSNDEIGSLVESFNFMLSKIQNTELELQQTRDQIENRVQDRTRELEAEVEQKAKIQSSLEQIIETEKMISKLSTYFLNLPPEKADEGVHEVFRNLGNFLGNEFSYVVERSGEDEEPIFTHVWESNQISNFGGLSSQKFKMSKESYKWIYKQTVDGTPLNIFDVSEIPEEASYLNSDLESRLVKSGVFIPMINSGKTIGIVGFESTENMSIGDDVLSMLKLTGEMFVGVLERKRVLGILHESRNMLNHIMDNIPQTIFWKDSNFVYTGCNKTFSLHAGFDDPSEVVGKTDDDMPWTQEQKNSYSESEQNILNSGVSEYRMVHTQNQSDSKGAIIEVNRVPLYDSNNNIVGILGTYEDITNLKEMEEELIKGQKLKSLGNLAGGIAHDFNNLLTGIMGNITLANICIDEKDMVLERLREAEIASVRAQVLTNQLLTFSRGGEPIKKIMSLSDLLENYVNLSLTGSNLKCDFFVDDGLWAIEADEGQISQVIHNLVINANEAMEDGGTIEVYAKNVEVDEDTNLPLAEGKYVMVSIKDYGKGISEYYLPNIFDPYFSTKKQGNGLGLSTSYSIIKKHKGHINVDTEEGKGSEFSIYLPAIGDYVPEKRELTVKELTGSGIILLMDDEQLIRNVAGKMLQSFGYDVVYARDGGEAIDEYRKYIDSGQTFDAVILDLTVSGGMGGKDTIKELIQIDPSVKAIVSTGYSNDPVMADFQSYGFVDYVPKPYKAKELAEVVGRVVSVI